jgi:hypothetical protein
MERMIGEEEGGVKKKVSGLGRWIARTLAVLL